jgi:hypothetical protein
MIHSLSNTEGIFYLRGRLILIFCRPLNGKHKTTFFCGLWASAVKKAQSSKLKAQGAKEYNDFNLYSDSRTQLNLLIYSTSYLLLFPSSVLCPPLSAL